MKIALVTGANSGVGLETAFQLAKAGYGRVLLGCRTTEKAEAARAALAARGAADVLEALAVDVADAGASIEAAEAVVARGYRLDLLVLNAGTAGGAQPVRTRAGIEMTFASAVIGHHAMTLRLREKNALSDDARILIAGSEASRGDVMGMKIPDLDAMARADFGGDARAMLEAFAKGDYPSPYAGTTSYPMAKLFAAWWAAGMAPHLPKGVAVFAVSPGNTPTTNMGRDLPWPVRTIIFPLLGAFGPFIGMAHSVEAASQRYLEASRFGVRESGKFFASPATKLVGPMIEQHTRWLDDRRMQHAACEVIESLAKR